MADIKWSQFPNATPNNSDEVVGLHSGDNARFTIANIVAAVRNGLANIFVPKTDVGAAGGVAELDSMGKVPGNQLDLSGKQSTITASGILKGDGQGGVTAATPGTDYATPSQLAYVESGTTASQNYTAGQYISLNGLLYTVDTAIASGATFYTSGGNKNLTECVGGGLNNLPSSASGLKVQEFMFTTATLGTSFSQTSRAIDTTQNLFGIDATHICSIFIRDNTLTPNANMIFGIWGGTLYMAATQSCTLSDYLPVRIVVVYY